MKVHMLYCGRFSQIMCVLLAVTMAVSLPVQAWAQQGNADGRSPDKSERKADVSQVEQLPRHGGDTALLAAPGAGKFELDYISPQAVVVAAIRPRQMLTSPVLALTPIEVVAAAGLKYLGYDPADFDQVTVFSELPLGGPPNYGVIVKFAEPFKMKSIPSRLTAHTQPGTLDDEPYLESAQPLLPSIYSPDTHTLVIAPDLLLRRLVNPPPNGATGALVTRLGNAPAGDDLYIAADIAALRPLIAIALMQAKDVPPELKPLLDMPNLISSVDLTFNLTHEAPSQLIVHANDEASAEKLLAQVKSINETWQNKFVEQAHAAAEKDPNMQGPIGQAYLKYIDRVGHTPPQWHVERAGSDISLFSFRSGNATQQLVMVAVIGILVALLLPAVQAAREAARRTQATNNLRQQVLAMHNYHDAKRSFPAHAICDANGKPLLSWRVQILPFLEQQALYNEFHLDEPWDSDHNKPLIERMPDVYADPSYNLAPGKTAYLAVVGDKCAFDGTDKGLKISQFTDGTSKTALIVEANPDRAVEWTKPDDLPFDPKTPTVGIGASPHPGIWLAAFADGAVHTIGDDVDPQIVKAMMTRNGEEAFQLPESR